MAWFWIPDTITITVQLEPRLLDLLTKLVDQQADRESAALLTKRVQDSTKALSDAVPKP